MQKLCFSHANAISSISILYKLSCIEWTAMHVMHYMFTSSCRAQVDRHARWSSCFYATRARTAVPSKCHCKKCAKYTVGAQADWANISGGSKIVVLSSSLSASVIKWIGRNNKCDAAVISREVAHVPSFRILLLYSSFALESELAAQHATPRAD